MKFNSAHKAARAVVMVLFGLTLTINPAFSAIRRLSPHSFNSMYNLAARGDVVSLRDAIKRGLDINAVNSAGDTGLCVAVKQRNVKAYNTFRAVDAHPRPPCSWNISYYDDFVNSRAVQSGATWRPGGYTRPTYVTNSKTSNAWAWGAGALLIGGGAAIALSGGGGGGSSGSSGNEGLSCEYGCKTYNSENKCVECNEKPSGDCDENPCGEGCYTDITCGEGTICTQTNSCGGCEQCGSTITSQENFVKTAESSLTNTDNLVQTGTGRTGNWGGIYTPLQQVDNRGSIGLSEGSGGIGIMSCLSDNLETCLAQAISAGGKDITNSGEILVTADNSIGIFATTLAQVENNVIQNNNTLSSLGSNIALQGKDNAGIVLRGNGNILNNSTISLKGEATHSHKQADTNNSDWAYFQHIDLEKENSGIYFDVSDAGYLQEANNIVNRLENTGKIDIGLTTDKSLSSALTDNQREFLSVSGINAKLDESTGRGSLEVDNSGEINVSLNVDEAVLAASLPRLYWAAGISATNTDYQNPSRLIHVSNMGNINLSGNATLYGIIANGAVLENRGDIMVNLQGQNSYGLSGHNSTLYQYGNIDSSGNGNFYAAALDNSVLNLQAGSVTKGKIIGNSTSVVNNYGQLNSSDIQVNAFNNMSGGKAEIGEAFVDQIQNEGTLNGSADQWGTTEISLAGSSLLNQSGGIIEASGVSLGKTALTNFENSFYQSLVNEGTITANTLLLRTSSFENRGTVQTDSLVYESFNQNGDTVDLTKIDFSQDKSLSQIVMLSSAGQDAFRIGALSSSDSSPQVGSFRNGYGIRVSDVFGDAANGISGGRSSLEAGNVSLLYNLDAQFASGITAATLNGLQIERKQFDTVLNGNINMTFADSINGVTMSGEDSTLTNNGSIEVMGNAIVSGVISTGSGSTIVNNGNITVNNMATQLAENKDYGTFGIYMSGGEVQTGADSFISVESAAAEAINTNGIFLSNNSFGTNNGHIIVQSPNSAVGVKAVSTTAAGFVNNGTVEVNSLGGTAMFADGYVDGVNDRYAFLANNGDIYTYADGTAGMTANGANSEVANTGNIRLRASQGAGMYVLAGGRAYNRGMIDLGENVPLNIGMFANSGSVFNESGAEIKGSANNGELYGVYLSGQSSGENAGTIEIAADNSVGVYAESTIDTGFKNSGTITLTGSGNIGMWADGYDKNGSSVNDLYVYLVNTGTINVSGDNAVGMLANGSKSTVTNKGTINVSTGGTALKEENGGTADDNSAAQAFVVSRGATFINEGVISSDAALNLDDLRDNESLIVAGKNSLFKGTALQGKLAAGADIVMGSNAETYVNKGTLEAKETNINLLSNSAMFEAALKTAENDQHDIVMTRKSFSQLVDDQAIAAYLEKNYAAGNRVDVYDQFKAATNGTTLNNSIAQQLGAPILPALNYQNLQRIKYFNRTMEDLILNDENVKDERVSVVSNNYFSQQKAKGGVSGYEDHIYGVSAIFDKALTGASRYGVGFGLYHSYADFDGSDSRKDLIAQLYLPYQLNYPKWGAIVMPFAGYGHGEYKRVAGGKKYQPDIDVYYYGLSNRLYLNHSVLGLKIEPTAELNLSGAYQDKISEDDGGLTLKAQKGFSAETGLGAYAARELDWGDAGRLNLRAGAMYYYELNDKAYDSFKAQMAGMQGAYQLDGYPNRRSRGMLSLRADYAFKGWNLYGEIIRLLESGNNIVGNAGLKVSF